MTEHDIMRLIEMELSKHGVVMRLNVGSFKTFDGRVISGGLPPGTSDILFIGNGYVAFIEVKKPGGRISPEQLRFINKMCQLGHRAGVAYSVDDAMKILGG
ncbi:MAG: VRR-NUC domain-containing protein [Defluviitaleaceae bacterium]|nr:VRR-NUC domain-containing protein [Defluviitaleaceae bacterium]